MADLPWSEEFQRRFDEERAKLGRFNVLICGKTGVGKSTLINAIFGKEVAATGNGVPVTLATEYFTHERLPLGVFDSQGFETGQSGDEILRRLRGEMSKGGGYILAPAKTLQPGTPTENAAAVVDAFTSGD